MELRGDLDRFFKLTHADAKAAGSGKEDVQKIESLIRKIKSSLPDESGEEDETEIQKLDEVPPPERRDDTLLEKGNYPTSSVRFKVLKEIDDSMFLLSEDYEIAVEMEDLIKLVGKK